MENCDQAICLDLLILFLYATPHKIWHFEKFMFELEAFWDTSKINSTLVTQLKSLKKIISKIYYFNFMVSYLYAFNPRIGINENCKYLSHNNS